MWLRIDKLAGLGAIALAVALAGCSTLAMVEPVMSPPSVYQLDRTVPVEFVAGDAVGRRCAERGVTFLGLPGFNSGACGSRDLITLPDPCAVSGDDYARGLCAGVGAERVAIAFVHPDLAAEHCRARGGSAAAGVVVCATAEALVVVNPCLTDVRSAYAELGCHELGHANGWTADHAGGSYLAQPAFVKRKLAEGDVLSPEAVRVALLAKAAEQR